MNLSSLSIDFYYHLNMLFIQHQRLVANLALLSNLILIAVLFSLQFYLAFFCNTYYSRFFYKFPNTRYSLLLAVILFQYHLTTKNILFILITWKNHMSKVHKEIVKQVIIFPKHLYYFLLACFSLSFCIKLQVFHAEKSLEYQQEITIALHMFEI